MLKKTFAATVVAGALLFTGAGAATAANYPVEPGDISISDPTPVVGQPITITIVDIDVSITSVIFSVDSAGATLAAIVPTAGNSSVTKPVTDGTAAATFTANAPGDYTVTVTDAASGDVIATVPISVAAAAGDGDALPSTGGTVPTAALWIGAGALGLGGVAVVAATARRRAAQR